METRRRVPEQPMTSVSAQRSKAKDVAEKIMLVQRDHGNRVEYVSDQNSLQGRVP